MCDIGEEEVLEAIWSLEPHKVPGPYGFSISLFRVFMNMIKNTY